MEILIIVLLISILLFFMKPFYSYLNRNKLPYQKATSLLTPGEKAFYPVLKESIKNEPVFIMSKVRFADLLYLPRNTKDFYTHLHKVTSKHVDFVLCEPYSLKILVVIELDDPSHLIKENRERDDFKNQVLNEVGIPLVRIQTKKNYSPNDIYLKIKPFI